MKKILVIMLVLAFMATMAVGCSPKAPAEKTAQPAEEPVEESAQEVAEEEPVAEEERLTITFVSPLLAHPVWLLAKDAFEQAGEDLNFEAQWVGPTGIDANEMVKQMELAIASGVDGIITMAIAPEAMAPAFKKAEEAGIPVVVVTSDAVDSPRMAYLGLDNINFGKVAAETAMSNLNGEKPVIAAMVAALDYEAARQILASAEETFGAAGEYEWATTVESKSDMLVAVKEWQNVLNTYPEVNTIITVAAEAAPAAGKVIEEMDLVGEITVVGISDMAETLDYIRKGTVYATMSENFPRMGYQPAQWICEFVREGKTPNLINDTGTIPITLENIDIYQDQLRDRTRWE